MVGGFCVVLLVAFFVFCLYRWSHTHTMTITHIYTESAHSRASARERVRRRRGGAVERSKVRDGLTDRNTETKTKKQTDDHRD